MKLFPGLMLDRAGIVLKPRDMTFQQLVLAQKRPALKLEIARVEALVLIDRKTVLAKDDVVRHRHGEHGREHCREPAPSNPPENRTRRRGTLPVAPCPNPLHHRPSTKAGSDGVKSKETGADEGEPTLYPAMKNSVTLFTLHDSP